MRKNLFAAWKCTDNFRAKIKFSWCNMAISILLFGIVIIIVLFIEILLNYDDFMPYYLLLPFGIMLLAIPCLIVDEIKFNKKSKESFQEIRDFLKKHEDKEKIADIIFHARLFCSLCEMEKELEQIEKLNNKLDITPEELIEELSKIVIPDNI